MAFNRPTLAELIARIAADIDSRLTGTDSQLRRSNTAIIARAAAGVAHGLHGHLEWGSKQFLASSADDEQLVVIGGERDLSKTSADFARGLAAAAGAEGAVIPADSVYQRADGVQFKTSAEATVADGSAAISLIAVVAGVAGNTAAGTSLSLITPIEDIDMGAIVDADGLAFGKDIESTEAFRLRVVADIRRPPAGGNKYDYVAWAISVTGVARAWTVPNGQGPGTVDVLILADAAITGSETPSADLLAAVRAYLVDLCPADVKFLRVLAPAAKVIDLTISVTPDTAAVRSAVQAELQDLLLREAAPGVTILRSHIVEAISIATGEADHALLSPAGDTACTDHEMAELGAITWA